MCCCYASTEAFVAGACAYNVFFRISGATPGTFRGLPVIAGDKRGDLVLLPFATSRPRIPCNPCSVGGNGREGEGSSASQGSTPVRVDGDCTLTSTRGHGHAGT